MVQLGAVCSRTIDGTAAEFGTTGYTKDNTFLLYDRVTDSMWWPMSDRAFEAVSGKKKRLREYRSQPWKRSTWLV